MMVDFRERETDLEREIEIDFFRFSVLISGEGRRSPYIFFFTIFFSFNYKNYYKKNSKFNGRSNWYLTEYYIDKNWNLED